MSVLEAIMQDLKTLPPPKLEEVLGFVHRLREGERNERLRILRETSGALSGADADVVEKAIADGCEQIDATAW